MLLSHLSILVALNGLHEYFAEVRGAGGDGLVHECVHSLLNVCLSIFRTRVGAHPDHRGATRPAFCLPTPKPDHHLRAAQHWHDHIGEDHVKLSILDHTKPLLPVHGRLDAHVCVEPLQAVGEELPDASHVVDDQAPLHVLPDHRQLGHVVMLVADARSVGGGATSMRRVNEGGWAPRRLVVGLGFADVAACRAPIEGDRIGSVASRLPGKIPGDRFGSVVWCWHVVFDYGGMNREDGRGHHRGCGCEVEDGGDRLRVASARIDDRRVRHPPLPRVGHQSVHRCRLALRLGLLAQLVGGTGGGLRLGPARLAAPPRRVCRGCFRMLRRHKGDFEPENGPGPHVLGHGSVPAATPKRLGVGADAEEA
mmetsp:Transcript_38193/g.97634  ORF Transcript_38193/g.97634 Transcript_38193/m.97634 type:complete len:366 (+) Transcript_38193:273-1370(+)